ncbi:MAG: hypothetical protein IT323_04130 [Anaerolineae bacterium]|nr:hypothetical protein [Anaerolineae bacterium]
MATPPGGPSRSDDPLSPFSIERRYAGEMILFTFVGTVDDSSVDQWREALDAYIDGRPGAPRYCIYDLTGITDWGLTPRAREKLAYGASLHPDARGRVAIITPPMGPLRAVIDLFRRSQLSVSQPTLDVRLFSSLEEGLAWVAEILPPALR